MTKFKMFDWNRDWPILKKEVLGIGLTPLEKLQRKHGNAQATLDMYRRVQYAGAMGQLNRYFNGGGEPDYGAINKRKEKIHKQQDVIKAIEIEINALRPKQASVPFSTAPRTLA